MAFWCGWSWQGGLKILWAVNVSRSAALNPVRALPFLKLISISAISNCFPFQSLTDPFPTCLSALVFVSGQRFSKVVVFLDLRE